MWRRHGRRRLDTRSCRNLLNGRGWPRWRRFGLACRNSGQIKETLHEQAHVAEPFIGYAYRLSVGEHLADAHELLGRISLLPLIQRGSS